MKLWIFAVGTRMPAWVDEGVSDYARRMPAELRTELVALRPEPRSVARPVERLIIAEGDRLLAALPRELRVIALDERGVQWTTQELARHIEAWMHEGRDTGFVIGGADGLDPRVLARADYSLGLSRLTLPHGLARVLLTEQLYRAASLIRGHPYHRP